MSRYRTPDDKEHEQRREEHEYGVGRIDRVESWTRPFGNFYNNSEKEYK